VKVLRRVLVSHFYGVLLGGLSGLSKTKIFDVLVIISSMVNYFSTGFNEETVYYSPGGGGRTMSPPKAPSRSNSTRRPKATFPNVSKIRTTARATILDTFLGYVPFGSCSADPEQRCVSTGDICLPCSIGCDMSQKCSSRAPYP